MRHFSTRSSLMPHQERAVAKLLPPRVGALFMDMGTGKSRTLIELARIRQEKWDKLFWFTPCSLRDNVREQLLIHTDLEYEDIELWDSRTMDRGVRHEARVHVVGIESMSSSDRTVLAYNSCVTKNSFVAVDESAYIKGNRSKRSQRITHMSSCCRYRAIMTGTPFSQGPVDLYSQMFFLSPNILGYRSFWSFAANHLEYEERRGPDGRKRKTGRIIRSHNAEYLAAKIAPYTYQVRKDECLDLPEKLYETRYFSMTAEQRDLYEEAKLAILSLDYDDWSPIRLFHLFTSLQSIVCGFWRRPDGTVEAIGHPRTRILRSTIGEIPEDEQVIIWAKYRHSVREIHQELAEEYGEDSVCLYYGEQTDTARAAHLSRWRAGARFLVATQSTGGHGLTLNEAAYTIFYADSFKHMERAQAEDRNHRIGQTRRPVYVSLHCSRSIDDRISSALARKGNALEEFQQQIEECRNKGLRERAMQLVRSL